MTRAEQFAIFILEQYAYSKQIEGLKVYNDFQKTGKLKYLIENFEALHTLGQDYIFEELDSLENY